jgi:hypothetical protein
MKKIQKRGENVFAGRTMAELEALTADLDQEFIGDSFGPMSEADRKLWRKAKRRRGRPTVGKGVKVVSVSIERGLLAKSDKLAKELGISRARLVAEGLQKVISELEAPQSGTKKRTRRAA